MNEQSTFIIPPMPEPVEVWLVKHGGEPWQFFPIAPSIPYEVVHGPYYIIPGMMSLDELAEHDLFVMHRYLAGHRQWYVAKTAQMPFASKIGSTVSTAIEAQWAATYIAENPKENKL